MTESLIHFFNSSQQMTLFQIFILLGLMIMSSLLFFPLLIWKLFCGYKFGWGIGFLLISISYICTLWLTLYTAHRLDHHQLRAKIKSSKLESFLSTIEKKGAIWIILLRLNPLAHFSALNYSLAFTKIPKWKIIFFSWLGSTPLTLVTLWIGNHSPSLWQSQEEISQSPFLYAIGLILILIYFLYYKLNKRPINSIK